jgi:DNA ligase-1
MKFLGEVAAAWKTPFAALHEHAICTGFDHLITELDRVTALGGEGLMLRKPGSHYERTRSMSLLKVKKFLDAEATVTGYEAGAGRHKGRVGALLARLGNGKEFKVGTGLKDRERDHPPPVGSIFTVKYQELTKDGIPRFPVFVGLRPDGNPHQLPPARQRPGGGGQESGVGLTPTALTPDSRPLTPVPGGSTMAATPKRYFEFGDSGAGKFWEIWMDGNDVTTRWGRIGTDGQTKTKNLADEVKAKKEYDKLLAEKTGKGYGEKPRPA